MIGTASDSGFVHAAGRRSLDGEAAMSADTVMWIASMSKLVTVVAVLQCVERGELAWETPLSACCPEFDELPVLEGFDTQGDPLLRRASRSPTIRELLTHTAGCGYEFLDADLARYFEHFKLPPVASGAAATLRRPRVADPGQRWDYGIGLDWAGRAVEEVSGLRLGEVFRQRVFGPLGMADSGFLIDERMRVRLAGMHARKPDGTLIPLRFEVNQNADHDMGGHGLYSTPQDFMRLLRMLLRGGELDGVSLLSADSVAEMARDQLGATGLPDSIRTTNPRLSNDIQLKRRGTSGWGLSVQLARSDVPDGRSAGSYSWAGLCNSHFWIDPHRDVAGLLMTQVLPFFDAPTLALLDRFEAAVYRARE